MTKAPIVCDIDCNGPVLFESLSCSSLSRNFCHRFAVLCRKNLGLKRTPPASEPILREPFPDLKCAAPRVTAQVFRVLP